MLSRPKMSQTVYFHVDVRPFTHGDIIPPAGKFIDRHKPIGTAMEELLRLTAPKGSPERGKQLFVFENEDCARYHCIKTAGGRLYRVTLEGTITHRGDMALLDEIGATLDEPERNRLANQYWAGDPGPKPCIEVMIPKAKVVDEIVLTRADRRAIMQKAGFRFADFSKETDDDLPFVDMKPKGET